MAFSAGDLDQCVILQEKVASGDGAGGQDHAWQDVRKEFAMVRPLSGRERLATGRTEDVGGYLVVIRARPDIVAAMRFVWDGRELNIRFLKKRNPRAMFQEIECTLGDAT